MGWFFSSWGRASSRRASDGPFDAPIQDPIFWAPPDPFLDHSSDGPFRLVYSILLPPGEAPFGTDGGWNRNPLWFGRVDSRLGLLMVGRSRCWF